MRKLVLVFLLATALCHSQIKTFIREYTYTAGEADSKITSRAIALDQAKRILLEEIGVYIHSTFEMYKEEKNNVLNELTKEQIQSITAGVTETKIVEEKWNGETYYIKASITVDPNEVNRNIARIGADQSKVKELEEVSRKADDALAEIERLRKELAIVKSDTSRSAKQKEYDAASNTLSALDWFQKGYNAYESKDYQGAVEDYTKVISLKPDYVDAYYSMGLARAQLGDYQGEIADMTKAISVKPDYADAYFGRGFAKARLQDVHGAVEDYTKAISLRPDFVDVYLNRAALKSYLKDYQGAVEDYTKIIGLKPDDASAYYDRGLAKAQLGDYQGEIADMTKAISVKPDYADGYFGRGFAKACLKDVHGAVGDYTKAISLRPDFVDVYLNRAALRIELKDREGAVEDYTKIISLKPDYADAYYGRGLVYLSLDQKDKARSDFMKAIELGYRVPQETLDACK